MTDLCLRFRLCVEVSDKDNEIQWRIFQVFKVFSEHLEMKKKIKKSVCGHSSAINVKNCLHLCCFLRQRIHFLTRPNDFCLSAQA